MKKIVVFGGGTGLSCLLSGLKLFPLDVTTVIAVSDNGSSTGVLKEELNIPAVGDIGKVLLSMANVDSDFVDLLGYRFSKEGSLHNHPIRNIMLAALIDIKGNLTDATKYMSELLKVKGTVLPLTEEKVELVGEGKGEEFFGEECVSMNIKNIRRLRYDHDVHVAREVKEKIMDADLIIFSPGSLYTSVLPHLLAKEVISSLKTAKAPIMYICNLVTQPGETDGYSVGDHVNTLNSYLKDRKIDVVIANNGEVDKRIRRKYLDTENKEIVEIAGLDDSTDVIASDIFSIEDEKIRHDALKTAYLVFSYLMNK
ncbi:MAG: uridine diphosphate-N-acetylglucosamine-binding protein YvcK [Lachnospiraceae bacterium]|nr:uridine diphosphate-N-acetylglucosamine-binding protein YvcK [Lachnospiraceae bacterium]